MGVLGPGDFRSAETLERRFREFGHSKNLSGIPRTFRPGPGPMGPMGPGPGPMGPYIGPYVGPYFGPYFPFVGCPILLLGLLAGVIIIR